LGIVLLALAVLAGCSGGTALQPWAPGDPVVSAPNRQPPIVGVTYHPTWAEMTDTRRGQVLDQLVEAGVSWLRVDVSWKEFQPDGSSAFDDDAIAAFDTRLDEIGDRGFKILLMFYWAPVWATGSEAMSGRPSASAFARATGWVVDTWGEQLSALEIWNEPDTARFWDPQPERTRVTDFTDMVIQASRAAKSVQPELPVIVGGTSRIDTQWWAQVLSLPDLAASVDAIAVHPYTVPSDLSPRAPDTGKPWRVRHLRSLVELLDQANLSTMPIWITEFGWSTGQTSQPADYERAVSESQQATYLTQALEEFARFPQVRAAFWYTDVDHATPDPHQNGFGLMRTDGSRKPSYYAMKCAASGVCGPGAGP
jgi:hypothetical protein